jgi:MFS family permease
MTEPWRNLWLLALTELLAMALWFSATAVAPQLTAQWNLSGGQQAWLTMSVQLGFVAGALTSAVLNLADRFSARRLLAVSALAGAALNAAIPLFTPGFYSVVLLRLLTGVTLAGVYPTGMKLMATWFQRGRGLAIGILVGALTIGSAAPHLASALPRLGQASVTPSWPTVLWLASASAVLASAIAAFWVQAGPLLPAASRFDWRQAAAIVTNRPVRLANFGYLGHMWELYAMWAWTPACLREAYSTAGWSESAARVAAFAVIASGGIGCVLAGLLADRLGRTTVAIASLAVSGICALIAGSAIGHPALLTAICLLWGVAVVADSAQFSAAISELGDARYVGTLLTMQTCTGFLLTMFTIRMIPPAVEAWGWGIAFALLSIGPALGIWSMATLRRLPEAVKMASGNR